MSTPTFVGASSSRQDYGVGSFTRDLPLPAGVAAGDLLLIHGTIAAQGTVTVDTAGSTVLQPTVTVGSRAWFVLARSYASGTTTPLAFATTAGGGMTVTVTAIRGADLPNRRMAALWTRLADGTGATDLRTIARARTVEPRTLVVGLHAEATTAAETGDGVTAAGGTIAHIGRVGSAIETNLVTTSQHERGGTSAQHVATWQNASQNGAGLAVALPRAAVRPSEVMIGGVPHQMWGWDGQNALAYTAPAPAPAGVAARWTFDHGTADVVAGRTLALASTALAPAPGRGGQALAAPGAAGSATVADGFLDRAGFSIGFWLYTPPTADTVRAAFTAAGTTVAELYGGWRNLGGTIYETARVLVVTDTGSYNRVVQANAGNGAAVPAQRWRHVVGTYDGAALTLYLDGTQRATGPKTGVVLDPDAFVLDLVSGAMLDDVTVWSYPLTAGEVAALYAAG